MVEMTNIKREGNIVSCDCLGDGREKFFLKFNTKTGENLEATTDNMIFLSEAKFKLLFVLVEKKELPNELTAMSF